MTKATIGTVRYGHNEYQRVKGKWFVLAWGWWPEGTNPRWGWIDIPLTKVPVEVRLYWYVLEADDRSGKKEHRRCQDR